MTTGRIKLIKCIRLPTKKHSVRMPFHPFTCSNLPFINYPLHVISAKGSKSIKLMYFGNSNPFMNAAC